MTRHHHPADTLTTDGDPVRLTPEGAGWNYCGLHVMALVPGESRRFSTADTEMFVLPLSATDVIVEAAGERFDLAGRTSVFARVTDFAYVGRDTDVTVTSASGGEIALPSATCEQALPPRFGAAVDVAVEVRGAGQATRSISNFGSPESWEHADKLMCVEVYTPDGNWSSYPPHKHDDSPECPVNNEEVYYFRIGRAGSTEYAPDGSGCTAPTPVSGPTSTRRSGSMTRCPSRTAMCTSSHAATTGRASPRPATRCTTSTSLPAPAVNGRWRSVTTRRTTGYAPSGSRCPPMSAVRW
jgi:5-deoxy-D-glucuronate isomerase